MNQLLNKSASSSTSLYQQCSQLRQKLVRIEGFAPFLSISSPLSAGNNRQSQSTDPVRQLWDCFALGTPLCFLYNLLPTRPDIDVNTNPNELDLEDTKARKHATAKFIIGITEMKRLGEWPGEIFTIMELHSDARDTNGFVRVVSTVMRLVDLLPSKVFKPEEAPPTPPSLPTPFDPTGSIVGIPPASFDGAAPVEAERERNQVIRELIETERKYVGDLEVMREYATTLSTSGVMDLDTIHHLFPGLNQLLDFQRQFLIVLEGIYEQPWQLQRWGSAFTAKEEEFAVYEPYCANYTNASELLQVEEQNLMALCDILNPRSELPAFLIKPVQRICKYPLLLESLVKKAGPEYPYRDELVEGHLAAKRITDRVNEAQRRQENLQTVKNLEQRVEDWKGHHLSHFGQLLLDEIFFVTKAEVDREYHVFLFEKIILCCKEAVPTPAGATGSNKKAGKSNSILKKNMTAAEKAAAAAMLASQGGKKRMTPLLLKGRIFLNNVTAATPSKKDGHALQVWWRGDEDIEYFTLRCRTEEQMKQWETTINKLIARNDSPRRPSTRYPSSASATQTTYNPQQVRGRYTSSGQMGGEFPVTPGTPAMYPGHQSMGYPQRERVDSRNTDEAPTDEENWISEEHGYESPYSTASGRATPSGARRPHASLPPGKAHAGSLPLPINPARNPLLRGLSTASDASFTNANAPPPSSGMRQLRSQFSSTRLRSAYEDQNGRQSMNQQFAPSPPASQPPHARLRSASTPTHYNPNGRPQDPPPPMPINTNVNATWSKATGTPTTGGVEDKRGSGSSQSTNVSSDYSVSQTTSPVTPYGSNESNLSALRPMRSQVFAGAGEKYDTPVRVKVHYKEDLFVIVVQKSIDYAELMEKVGKKIRLCGARGDQTLFKVRYRDEDGDMISLASNDDLQIAFDSHQVVLYVV